MWSALLEGGWNSLALVPTDHSVSVDLAVDALRAAIQKAGEAGAALHVIDARGVDVVEGKRRVADLRAILSEGKRAVVLVDSLIQSLSGVHLVSGVDAVVLVVHVGALDFDALTSTVTLIGPDRILGSVTAPSIR
jgi:hypothetical protein